MSKAPSEKTQLAQARREIKHLYVQLAAANAFRARATKAEQELAEWKQRFDRLLARTSTLPPVVGSGVATSVNCGCIPGAEVSCSSTACPRRFPQSYIPTLT